MHLFGPEYDKYARNPLPAHAPTASASMLSPKNQYSPTRNGLVPNSRNLMGTLPQSYK